MIQEWSEKNIYNSFNSFAKGLTYYDYYEAINKWRVGIRLAPLSPVEISLDLISDCQLKCSHCNFGKYLKEKKVNKISDDHLMSLLRFFSNWGVRGICFGGGGESTLHPKIWEALCYSKSSGMQNSIATNGLNFNEKTAKIAVSTCRWIGLSIDAATEKTYIKGRRGNYFKLAIENIKKMSELANVLRNDKINNCDVTFKFLVFSYNQEEIYDACKLAKSLGVSTFHVRTADYRHQGMEEWQKKNKGFNIELIKKQYKECHKLETNNFKVFSPTHKFNEDFTPKRDFNQCYASPLCLQINPTGISYLCPDSRELNFYKLGNHYPDPENIKTFWGSKEHYKLVFETGCKECTSRCTFNPYNKMFQDLFIDSYDPLCRNFC